MSRAYIASIAFLGQTGRYVLIQRLRDTERQLLATERPLESLAKLGQHGSEVQFYLRRTGPSSSSSSSNESQDQHDRSLPLRKPSEPEPLKRGAPKKSLTFNLGPSSSPRAKPKQSRKSLGHRDSPEPRATPSPVPHTSFLPGPSKEEVFRHVLQQQERLHALEAQLEVLEHEAQAWEHHLCPEPRLQEETDTLEKTLMRNQAVLASEELWEEELRVETEREKTMRRRLGELHAKLDECGRRLHEFTARSTQLERDIQREKLQAETPPSQVGPDDSIGVVKAELQSQQKQGEELEVEIVETEKALGKAENLLQVSS